MLAAYSDACAVKGVRPAWRTAIRECGNHTSCPLSCHPHKHNWAMFYASYINDTISPRVPINHNHQIMIFFMAGVHCPAGLEYQVWIFTSSTKCCQHLDCINCNDCHHLGCTRCVRTPVRTLVQRSASRDKSAPGVDDLKGTWLYNWGEKRRK